MPLAEKFLTRDDAAAAAQLQQVIDGAARRRRLVLAELDGQAARLRRRVRMAGALAIAAGCIWAATWLEPINWAGSAGFISACLAVAAGAGAFWGTSRANDRKAKNLLQCAMKLGELHERACAGRQDKSSNPKTPQEIAATLSVESVKLAGEVDVLVPSPRAVPRSHNVRYRPENTRTVVTLGNGAQYPAILLDLSCSGAAMTVRVQPPVGTTVRVGRTESRIIRTFKNGFAVEFLQRFPKEVFGPDFAL